MLRIDKVRRHNMKLGMQFSCIDRPKAKEIDVGSDPS